MPRSASGSQVPVSLRGNAWNVRARASYVPILPPRRRPSATHSRPSGFVNTRSAHGGPPLGSDNGAAGDDAGVRARADARRQLVGHDRLALALDHALRDGDAGRRRDHGAGDDQPATPATATQALGDPSLDLDVARGGLAQALAEVAKGGWQLVAHVSASTSRTLSPSRRCIVFRPRDTRARMTSGVVWKSAAMSP